MSTLGTAPKTPRVMVVSADENLGELVSEVAGEWQVVDVRSTEEAERVRRCDAVVVDAAVPVECAKTLLETIRETSVPCLLLRGAPDAEVISWSQRVGVEHTLRPLELESLSGFFERASEGLMRSPARDFAERHKLSPSETRLVSVAIAGSPRRELAAELGVTENTIKTMIRRILRKCGARSLDEVVVQALRET